MPSSPTPDYDRLAARLCVCELDPSPAEAHGILCALLCAGRPDARGDWLAEILAGTDANDLLAREARGELEALAEHTRAEIEGPGLGFTPLLPGDGRPLSERAVALYDWSRGFLYGLGVAGVDRADLSGQAREVFDDFAAITHMDLDALEEGEDSEEALTELTEFVWVAAMLIYAERCHAEEDV